MKDKRYPQKLLKISPDRLLSAGTLLIFTLLVAVAGGVIYLNSSSAASVLVSGRVYDTRTWQGIPGVVIFLCNNNGSVTTNATGSWSFPASTSQGYCARVESGIPSGWTGPSTNNQPEHASSPSYEEQLAGQDCYHDVLCGSVYQTWDRAIDSSVDFRYTSPTPPTTPPPAPKPSGGTTPTRSRPVTRNNTSNAQSPDTTAPTAPVGLIATFDNQKQVVSLSWQAATDNVAVQSYQIERSADQKNWVVLSSNVTSTNFDDPTIQFGTHYFYRVAAFDTSGNMSGYATADVSTISFQPNLNPDSDTILTSDDKVATVLIPAGAISSPAFCTLVTSIDTLPPVFSGYKFISGPYNLVCRDSTSAIITSFNKPLQLTSKLSTSAVKGVSTVAYFGQKDDNSWQYLTVTAHDKKVLSDKVNLDGFRTFVVMGKQKKSSFWITIFKIFVIIGILLALTRFIARQILKRRVQNQNEDYHRKAEGL